MAVFVKDTDDNFFEPNVNQSISDTIQTIDINRHLILEKLRCNSTHKINVCFLIES